MKGLPKNISNERLIKEIQVMKGLLKKNIANERLTKKYS